MGRISQKSKGDSASRQVPVILGYYNLLVITPCHHVPLCNKLNHPYQMRFEASRISR